MNRNIGAIVMATLFLVSLFFIPTNAQPIYPVVDHARAPTSLNVTVPDSPSLASSYIQASQPPVTPPTLPYHFTLFSKNITTTSGPGIFSSEFVAPPTPSMGWNLIALNLTASTGGTFFDTDYNVWMNNVTVLFGTLPEYGQYTIVKNITEYQSLFNGNVDWALRYPHGCVSSSCFRNVTLSITFYPATLFYPAVQEPSQVIPLWNYTTLTSRHDYTTVSATIPTDTTKVILEMYPYGYGVDEFWYADEPALRYVNLTVGGKDVAYVLPFPYINTGGIDLFAWRPITADFTLNDRPVTIDLTSALGMVEGTNNWNATINVGPQSYWHMSGDLLIYTSPNVTGAQLDSYNWDNLTSQTLTTPAGCALFSAPQCYLNESAQAVYSYSSSILNGTSVVEKAISSTSLLYSNNQSITPVWENVTSNEITSTTDASISINHVSTTMTLLQYPIAMQLGSFLVITGYDNFHNCPPPFGNSSGYCPTALIISLMNNMFQTFNETVNTNGVTSFFNNTVFVPISNLTGSLDFVAPTGAELTGISFNDASTTKVYTQYNWPSDPNVLYTHSLAGSDYINNETVATTSNDVENVYINVVSYGYTHPYIVLLLDTIGTLTNDVSLLSAQAQALTSTIHNDSLIISKQNATISDLNTTISTDKAIISGLRAQLYGEEQSLNFTNAALASLSVAYNESQANVSMYESLYSQLSVQVAQLNSTIANQTATINQLNAQVNALSSANSNDVAQANDNMYIGIVIGLIAGAVVAIGVGYVVWGRKSVK